MSRSLKRALVGVLSIVLALTLWLPWVYFGSAPRTSFGVFRSAQALGLDELAPFRVAWYLLPVVALAVLGVTALGHIRIAAVLLIVLALLLGLPALVVVVAGLSAWGSKLALAFAVAAVGVGLTAMIARPDPAAP